MPGYLTKTNMSQGCSAVYASGSRLISQWLIKGSCQESLNMGEGVLVSPLVSFFSAGVLVENGEKDLQGALARTAALEEKDCPAIFEAEFEHDGRRIRADVLKNLGEGKWALYELKSSTSVHAEHYHDAAFQAGVLRI
jgi:hypothetical protein